MQTMAVIFSADTLLNTAVFSYNKTEMSCTIKKGNTMRSSYTILPDHTGLTVEQYIKQILQISGRMIQKLTRQKGISLNGKPVFLKRKLQSGDTLTIQLPADRDYGVQPEAGPVEVLYEDACLLVINKPARQLVHPAGRTTTGTLANFLAYRLQQQGRTGTIRPVHRLDRDTSGCVIVAKDARSQALLEQQLRDRTLTRSYQALVTDPIEPPVGTIDAPIGPHPTLANRRAVNPQGETAVTHYRTLRSFSTTSLLELTLDTGRTHQIRVHLAHRGHPVVGDGMYGSRSPWIARQALHASAVRFRSPLDNREISVEAPLPKDFVHALLLAEDPR